MVDEGNGRFCTWKLNSSLWSFCLLIFCLGISSYSLYSNINNTWLIAPPNYIIFLFSIVAFIFGVKSFNHTYGWGKLRSWLTVILSLVLSLILFVVILFTSFFIGKHEPFQTVYSPDNTYTIVFYRWDPGATGAIGVRGEQEGWLWFKKRIYYEARMENVKVEWISNDTVSINNHILNLAKGDTYGY